MSSVPTNDVCSPGDVADSRNGNASFLRRALTNAAVSENVDSMSAGSTSDQNKTQTSTDASLNEPEYGDDPGEGTSHGPYYEPTTPVDDEDDDELYQVEKIVNRRITASGVEYRVKWYGYSSKHNTWEPEVNLDCPEQVAEFLENQKKRSLSNDNGTEAEHEGSIKVKAKCNKDKNIDKKTDKPEASLAKGSNKKENFGKVSDENIDKPENVKMDITEDVNMDQSGDLIIDKPIGKTMVKAEKEMMVIETGDDTIIVLSSDEEDMNDNGRINNSDVNDNGDKNNAAEDETNDNVTLNGIQDFDSENLTLEQRSQIRHHLYANDYDNKVPHKIIGATDASGELLFLIHWKHSDIADLVPSRIANEKWPHNVIAFYEERIAFVPPPNK